MADQSVPLVFCDGQVAWGNILWRWNDGQNILKGIPMDILPQWPEKAVFPHSVHTFHLAVGLIHLLDDPWVDVALIQHSTPFTHNLWSMPLLFFWSAVC